MFQHELLVVGGTPAGLSVAIEATEAGLNEVLLVEAGDQVAVPALIGHHALEARYRERVVSVRPDGDGVEVVSTAHRYRGRAVVFAGHPEGPMQPPPYPIPEKLGDRVHIGSVPLDPRGNDVLVVGDGELAIDWTLRLAAAGAGVVLALSGVDRSKLSRVAGRILLRLEAERLATVFWHTQPDAVGEVDGFPMAYFDDRRTPDLQFDHIVYAGEPADVQVPFASDRIDVEPGIAAGALWWVETGPAALPEAVGAISGAAAWESVRAARFPHLPQAPARPRAWDHHDRSQIEELRADHYNATISHFDRAHSDLWILRVRPDVGDTTHIPGQYASLGLGYWEPRGDSALESDIDDRWDRLVRRSYSISSRIFDEHGYLVDLSKQDELEFYVVMVPPATGSVPGLTPRLAVKRPGDRIYLGPRVAGRYTLAPVTDPAAGVVFLATGTGEAPHNAMIVELLRKGHEGPIVSVVSVRLLSDLGYLEAHRRLERRFANYHYLPLPTREPGVEKRYIQDVLATGALSASFGVELDPDTTHVFLCGNPAMIGLPESDDASFPQPTGAVEILSSLGFTLDRRGSVGNVHYEEYW